MLLVVPCVPMSSSDDVNEGRLVVLGGRGIDDNMVVVERISPCCCCCRPLNECFRPPYLNVRIISGPPDPNDMTIRLHAIAGEYSQEGTW